MTDPAQHLPKCAKEPMFLCKDCGVCTQCLGEYYHVTDALWEASGVEPTGGMLCIGCLEKRLGRELTISDFTMAPINNPFHPTCGRWFRSARFFDRLGVANRINTPHPVLRSPVP